MPDNGLIENITFSQTFVDEDANFECIVNYYVSISENNVSFVLFKLLSEDGNQILSDSGYAGYGFDGQNTYLISNVNGCSWKTWKLRSNISYTSRPLSKKSSPTIGPMMTYMPSGDFRVSLQPVAGGTSVQIFDMLGRQIFRKDVRNIREPASFIIPSSSLPHSPFVARVNNTNGSYVKKETPVH